MFSTGFYEGSSLFKHLNGLLATDTKGLGYGEKGKLFFFYVKPLKEFMILSIIVSHLLPSHKIDTYFHVLKCWSAAIDLSV